MRENTKCILNSENYIPLCFLSSSLITRSMKAPSISSACHGCAQKIACSDVDRRQMMQLLATGLATSLPFMATQVHAESTVHLLVDADAEKDFAPLRPNDLKLGKPLLVFPFDAKAGAPKNESRLNKLVLIRLPEDQMTPETRARSASGVLAYSGICTHQGCEVKTWMAKESVLACYCHASKFALLDGAKVVSGPAPKPLASIALSMNGEFLAIASEVPPSSGQPS